MKPIKVISGRKLVGVRINRKQRIPLEVTLDWTGNISRDLSTVLNTCYGDTEHVCGKGSDIEDQHPHLNEEITLDEVFKMILAAEKGKSACFDEIPVEALIYNNCLYFIHKLFNLCFAVGKVPSTSGR